MTDLRGVGRVGKRHLRPRASDGEALIEHETRRGPRPEDAHVPTLSRHGERRPAGRLHGVDRPEPAGEREIAAAHRGAGVRLPNRAADRKDPARARAASAINRVRVDGERLRVDGGSREQRENKRGIDFCFHDRLGVCVVLHSRAIFFTKVSKAESRVLAS